MEQHLQNVDYPGICFPCSVNLYEKNMSPIYCLVFFLGTFPPFEDSLVGATVIFLY